MCEGESLHRTGEIHWHCLDILSRLFYSNLKLKVKENLSLITIGFKITKKWTNQNMINIPWRIDKG